MKPLLLCLSCLSLVCLFHGCSTDKEPRGDAGLHDASADAWTHADAGAEDAGSNHHMVTETDVPYPAPHGGDEAMTLLDIYTVLDGAPRHLVVFIHGGGWVSGDKSNLALAPHLVPWFLQRGFVLAAPNFRLASPVGSPLYVSYAEQATDLAHALAWLETHGPSYGVTEPGILLLGFSSGAHLAALLAADQRYLASAGLSQDTLSGAMSFDVHVYDVPYALELMAAGPLAANIPLIEHLFGDTETQQRLGSPSSYAPDSAVPPTLLVSAEPSTVEGSHGYITLLTAGAYVDLLLAWGHDATAIHFDEETHNSLVVHFGQAGHGPTEAVDTFLQSLGL